MFGGKAKKKNKEYARLVAACKEGNVAEVEMLLAKGKAEVNRRDDEDWTPLFWACFNGHLDIVKLLVNDGAAVQLMDKQGRSPLYLSSGWGGEEITSFLLQHNGDVTKCNQDGWNCLHLCAYRGKDSVVELVLSAGCSLVQKDKQGRTPLDIAQKGNHQKVEAVLMRNAKKALLKGSQDGDHALVNGLLDLYKIDVDYADVTGWTPLHYAAKGGRIGIVKLLFSHGCSMDLKNRAGKTAFDVAEHGNDAVKLTLKKLTEEKEQKQKSHIMMAREDAAELLERKKAVQDSVDLRTRSSTAAPVRAKNSSVSSGLAIPSFNKSLAAAANLKSEAKEDSSDASGAGRATETTEVAAAKKDSLGQDDVASPAAKVNAGEKEAQKPKEEGARLNEVLAQMKQAKADRQAKMAEQKKALMASLSEEQKQELASRRDSSPSSPKGVVLSPRLMIFDKEAMAEKEAREKKEKEAREEKEAEEAAARAEAEEQARIKAEEEAIARLELPLVKRVLAAEWTDIESMLDAFEVPYEEATAVRLLHLAQYELNDELGLFKEPEMDTETESTEGAEAKEIVEKGSSPKVSAGDESEAAAPTTEAVMKASSTVEERAGDTRQSSEKRQEDGGEPGEEKCRSPPTEEKSQAEGNQLSTAKAVKADCQEEGKSSDITDKQAGPLSIEAAASPEVTVSDCPNDVPSAAVTKSSDTADRERRGAEKSSASNEADSIAPAQDKPSSESLAEAGDEEAKEHATEALADEGGSGGDLLARTAESEEEELQRLLQKYGDEENAGTDVTDDLLDHFDDLLADLDASTSGLDLDLEIADIEA